jgi:ribosomal protein S18 acetylase RimI-like enzyme
MSASNPHPVAMTASRPVLLTGGLRRRGLAKLFARWPSDGSDAADRLLELEDPDRLDLAALYGTVGSSPQLVSQVALALPTAGRTANLYLSAIGVSTPADRTRAIAELGWCVRSACDHLRALNAADPALPRVKLVQALLEPTAHDQAKALELAGLRKLARLMFLQRPISNSRASLAAETPRVTWPKGYSVQRVRDVSERSPDRAAILHAMDRSYIDTLDCPALCGIRTTEEVLASHLAAGVFDPSLWWILRRGDEPNGCMLLSRCPEAQTVELVYLGLAPEARGLGLGRRLLELADEVLETTDGPTLSCSVDQANAPAIRLYEQAGFRPWTEREAFVTDIIHR